MNINDLGVTNLLKLYDEKKSLTRTNNLLELIHFKKQYPFLFSEENTKELEKLLSQMAILMKSPYFQNLLYEDRKKKLIKIDFHQWQVGMLEKTLSLHNKINYKAIHFISRALVKEVIAMCKYTCGEYKSKQPIQIKNAFPFLGLLINEILLHIKQEKQNHIRGLAIFKMQGNKDSIRCTDSSFDEWKNSISAYSEVEEKIRKEIADIFNKIYIKLDQRENFLSDALFFCLMEVAEFIGLLAPNIYSSIEKDTVYSIINKIINPVIV